MRRSDCILAGLPVGPPLPFPPGVDEAALSALFQTYELENAPRLEMENYWQHDWKRFVYTYGLVANSSGKCLELGANPYFTTLLLKFFTSLDLTLANYFGPNFSAVSRQRLTIRNPHTGEIQTSAMEFSHFNIEDEEFPFPSAAFDIVLLCEVIEHLQHDPVKVLLQIQRILRHNGVLVLTTPNVSRLENVARMLAGANIYDPYSGYGPYGRHNREYNKHELVRLLEYCGYEVETIFSADVHANIAQNFFPIDQLIALVRDREHDLGQYLFVRARKAMPPKTCRPSWLYRSYPAEMLEE
jgi:SAM-dependent methyltransferase